MDTEITIRKARSADNQALANLWINLLTTQSELDPDVAPSEDARKRWENDFSSWLHDDSLGLLVAVNSDGLVGFARAEVRYNPPIYSAQKFVFLQEIFVDKKHRRQGIGSELVEAIRNWSTERGAARLRLSTVYSNQPARRFWEAMGAAKHAISYKFELMEPPGKSEAERSAALGFMRDRT